jgi:hypothetical protein
MAMAEHVRRQDLSQIENVDVAHEKSDVNIRAIFGVAAGLLATAIVVHVAMFVLFVYFQGREAARKPRAFPLATLERQLPPEPRIQARPEENLMDLRRHEDQILSSYAWVDEKAGVARIPIDEAMRLTIQRGLPVRAQEGQAK